MQNKSRSGFDIALDAEDVGVIATKGEQLCPLKQSFLRFGVILGSTGEEVRAGQPRVCFFFQSRLVISVMLSDMVTELPMVCAVVGEI